ncbi:hypothetical protein A4W72_05950 [Latilactobacillus curvatus]|nr:hypothetical protein A4W72_05950 [Latilactobacillus curvatus]
MFTFGAIKQAPFKDGEYVTVSFDYTNVGTGAYGTILVQLNETPWARFGVTDAMKDNGHVVRTVQWQSGWTTSGTATGILIRMDDVATTRTVTVYNMQFERGNKATDHKVAPEDTQGQIDKVNNGLADTNSKIAAVTKVDSQATAPTNPKKGDQWWVKDANGEINAFKIWDGTQWAPSTITQSLLIIKELDAVNINGSVINGSEFTNNFDFTGIDKIHFQGVTQIKDGAVNITWKIPENNQTGETKLDASGLISVIRDSSGTAFSTIRLQMGRLYLSDLLSGTGSSAKFITGRLDAQDTIRNSIATPTYYTNGWAPWTDYWPFLLKRNGRQITISGYLKNTGSSSSDFSIGASILRLPDWGEPFTPAIIPGTRQNAVTGSTGDVPVVLGLDKSGILHIESSGFKVGQWLSFSASYFGKDLS